MDNKNESLVPQSASPNEVSAPSEDEATAWLQESEKYALKYFLSTKGRAGAPTMPLGPSVTAGMLALYLNGRTLSEIRALNPHFSLGQIVHAAVQERWDIQFATDRLLSEARAKDRARQAAFSGVELASDLIAALRRLHGDNISRFLQSGRPEDLGGALSLGVIRQLKEVSEILMKLTGQEQNKKVSGTLTMKHEMVRVPLTEVKTPPAAEAKTLESWAAAEKQRLIEELKG